MPNYIKTLSATGKDMLQAIVNGETNIAKMVSRIHCLPSAAMELLQEVVTDQMSLEAATEYFETLKTNKVMQQRIHPKDSIKPFIDYPPFLNF